MMELIFYEEANKRYLERDTWSTKKYFSLVLFFFLGLDLKTYVRGKENTPHTHTHVAKIVHQPESEVTQILS